MLPHIQDITPSDAIRSLLPHPNGTYIVRRSTSNDEIIEKIDYKRNSEVEPSTFTSPSLILSVRVDETVYKNHVRHYGLCCTDPNILEDILKKYKQKQCSPKIRPFTPLKKELVVPPNDVEWRIDQKHIHDIDFSRLLNPGQHNSGISSAIWKCRDQHDIQVFIKRFKKEQSHFNQELSLLKGLCYPLIITCYGQYSDKDYSYLVFENGGESLESRCRRKQLSSTNNWKFIANVGFQVASAMIYLREKNIVHRDLTAGNVLINSHNHVRIADFGHAFKKEEGTNTLERATTTNGEKFQYRFLPPECLPGSKRKEPNEPTIITSENICAKFTNKSDVWSFGIVIIQMMLPNPSKPYPLIEDDTDIPKYVKSDAKIHPQPDECPENMYAVLRLCWDYDAKDRISFDEIRERMLKLEAVYL
ncbi:unnamed protein product [Adineta steineri]|uniref:Protein kinase domain-containing protein n=1 Tax=Adineta steineri TaxID=433720 RepID=A0A814BWC8_9BILA|nr:unnamed protein product [Adineta steineri]CAF3539201.1 unnamed protein product [Adineta steineri]